MTYYDPFEDIAKEMIELHDSKGKDYGTGNDPYRNVRASEEFGIPAWVGVLIRLNDKMQRGKTATNQLLETGEVRLNHEGVVDIFNDIAVYGVIGRILYEEWAAEQAELLDQGTSVETVVPSCGCGPS